MRTKTIKLGFRLSKRPDGEYAVLPQSVIDAGFDPSDRKFAAMACREGVPVIHATDSDWVEHETTFAGEGIAVRHLQPQFIDFAVD